MRFSEALGKATAYLAYAARIAAALAEAPPHIKEVWIETKRRVAEEVQRHAADPLRPMMFDGPGSHVHLLHVLQQVADERKVDLTKWWIEHVGPMPRTSRDPRSPT